MKSYGKLTALAWQNRARAPLNQGLPPWQTSVENIISKNGINKAASAHDPSLPSSSALF